MSIRNIRSHSSASGIWRIGHQSGLVKPINIKEMSEWAYERWEMSLCWACKCFINETRKMEAGTYIGLYILPATLSMRKGHVSSSPKFCLFSPEWRYFTFSSLRICEKSTFLYSDGFANPPKHTRPLFLISETTLEMLPVGKVICSFTCSSIDLVSFLEIF